MHLEFIDGNTAISATTRKRIRSHVARGKNAGRRLARPSRLNKAHIDPPTYFRIPALLQSQNTKEHQEAMCDIERPITSGLIFPVEMEPQTRDIAHKAFDFIRDLRGAPGLFHIVEEPSAPLIWVQYMFLDAAYFHSVIATCLWIVPGLISEQHRVTEASRHLLHTLRLINVRLAGENSTSDDTVAAVVGMVHYERHQGQFGRALIHTRGLRQMVDLRGGVLELGCELARKIFLCDIECSFQLGCEPLFSVEEVDAVAFSANDFGLRPTPTTSGAVPQGLNPYLAPLLRHGMHIALVYNTIETGKRKLTYYSHFDLVLSFGYRLLQFSPLQGPRPVSHLDDVIHLGLIIFLCTFIRRLDRGIADNHLLAKLLWSVAEKVGTDRETQEALLWALLVGTASILSRDIPEWLTVMVATLIQSLGLATWEDTLYLLHQYPWVNALHDEPARGLWQKVSPSSDT
ncbi:uncharacterized protein BO72DRAFT_396856 [Aspergillus fijiensis CBS 313.89]|uniref:Uncharacterized protein n=1 Tax=Aspergillus fijiensis CBS 313.89 TaxID=1448319 RepID=A0A8G1S1M7_9EURO|nr:uncharacterized protein BO72DRAFT_396856 [Aspergillus fijiensis CBS 313.89]RAK80781.1 hypothetical protein BO72DRAFT_396856 [Aspergillus fijiensis CBS 313.89]